MKFFGKKLKIHFFSTKFLCTKFATFLLRKTVIDQGCWNKGGREVNCHPTFAENLTKLLQKREFPLKFMSFAHPLSILPLHSYVSSNTPVDDCWLSVMTGTNTSAASIMPLPLPFKVFMRLSVSVSLITETKICVFFWNNRVLTMILIDKCRIWVH